MLRSRFLAMAILAVLSSGPASAEAVGTTKDDTGSTAPTKVAAANIDAESAEPGDSASASSEEEAAPAKQPVKALPPTLTAKINLADQSMTIYENGAVRYSWPISSGTATHPTPRGTFRPQWTAKMWYSRKYDNAPMPHAVFIHGGVAIHATNYVSRLGAPASHGCIRLAPGNAKKFYSLVHSHGMSRVRVSVYGTPNWRAPAVASRKIDQDSYASNGSQGGNWSWLFGAPPSSSAYNPNFVKKAKKPQLYREKGSKRLFYVKNGKRIYLQGKTKYSSNW